MSSERRVAALARDAAISRATGYRYLEEVITVFGEQAPDLHGALHRATAEGLFHVILDGKVFSADRCGQKATSVKAGKLICGFPAKPTSMAATSKQCRHPTAFHCGSRPSSPGRRMT